MYRKLLIALGMIMSLSASDQGTRLQKLEQTVSDLQQKSKQREAVLKDAYDITEKLRCAQNRIAELECALAREKQKGKDLVVRIMASCASRRERVVPKQARHDTLAGKLEALQVSEGQPPQMGGDTRKRKSQAQDSRVSLKRIEYFVSGCTFPASAGSAAASDADDESDLERKEK